MIANLLQFIREAKQELKKVVWPTKKQTLASTSVVLVFVIAVAIFLGLVDYFLGWLVKLVLS